MIMRLPLSDNAYATLVSVYAITMINQDENKEAFYQQPDEVGRRVLAGDKLIILEDFNAKIDLNHTAWLALLVSMVSAMRTQMANFCFHYAPSTISQSQIHSSN